jgi:hypothetical protein
MYFKANGHSKPWGALVSASTDKPTGLHREVAFEHVNTGVIAGLVRLSY